MSASQVGAVVFAVLFVGAWVVFAGTAVARPERLDAVWRFVRELPIFIRGLVWLAFLPWMIALAFWRGVLWPESWPRSTRYLAIAAIGVTWSLVVVDGAIS